MSRNGQTHFKNLAENATRSLKCIWPFLDIMHKRVKDKDILNTVNSIVLARFEMVALTSFSVMRTKHFLHLYQKMVCCVLVINQIFYPLWMTDKIPHSINPLSNALLLMDQLLLMSWHLWIAQPSKIIQRKCYFHSSYSNFNRL